MKRAVQFQFTIVPAPEGAAKNRTKAAFAA
jgi:hypothetical protein